MVNGIINTLKCTGCGACVDICPRNAISIEYDEEGFKRAEINKEKCLKCGRCRQVCHMNNASFSNRAEDIQIFAAVSNDINNVRESSSGGLFFELARRVLRCGGVVYGAELTQDLTVVHRRINSIDDIGRLKKSKYIESDMRGVYTQIKSDLLEGTVVLFSGTGCQIAGLYAAVGNIDNLYSCEVVCHGIPSEKVFKEYIIESGNDISNIIFRDKRKGWLHNSICEKYVGGSEFVIDSDKHPFHEVYLKGINMRHECSECRYAKLPRIADITLADFWKYRGALFNQRGDTGISLVAINNEKGKKLYSEILDKISWEKVSLKMAIDSCRHLTNAPIESKNRHSFFELLPIVGYSISALLCKTFERVMLPDQLKIQHYISVDEAIKVLSQNDSEKIYIKDKNEKIVGLIDFDSSLQCLLYGHNYICNNFSYVTVSENIDKEIISLFRQNPALERVPVLDREGKMICEIARRNSPVISKKRIKEINMLFPIAELIANGIQVFFIQRPEYLTDRPYSEKQISRINNAESFVAMCDNYEKYKYELKNLIGNNCDYEYISKLRKIPPIYRIDNYTLHSNQNSELVNVIDGERVTACQPLSWSSSVYMYGRCGVFGYAVDDANTIPSHLQSRMKFHNKELRVVNKGIWGAGTDDILNNLRCDYLKGRIRTEDKVIMYMDEIPYIEIIKDMGCIFYDTSDYFYEESKNKDLFFDKPGHMNSEGYSLISDKICDLLRQNESNIVVNQKLIDDYHYFCNMLGCNNESNGSEITDYINQIIAMSDGRICDTKHIGSIVMNCNPFTKGHRYLIEQSAKDCDELLVFVLEEDKSEFSFEERFEMVKRGTSDLPNVIIVPSGRFVLSSLTFPEYFIKEQLKEVVVDVSRDIKLFAEQIAPCLFIKTRFVGTEPTDKITRQYNEQMKTLLPTYGINLIEMDRLKINERFISATEVRRLIKDKESANLMELVPKSTYDYLIEKKII